MKKKLLALFLALSMAVSLVSPAVATGTANEGGDPAPAPEGSVVVGCGECGQAEGHADTCSQYVAPQPQPEEKPEPPKSEQKPEPPKPEQPPVKEEPAVCDCGTETDFHAKDCAAPEEAHEPAVVCVEDGGKFVAVKHHDDKHRMDLEKEYADTALYVVAEDFYQDLFFKCKVAGPREESCFEMKVESPDADGQLAEVTGEDLTFAMMTAEGHDAVVSLSPAVEPGTVITLTACELSEEEAAEAITDGEEVATYTVTIQVVEQDQLECQFCGVSLVVEKKYDKVTHKDDCQTNCTCQPVEGEHVEGCPLYVPPVEIPEEQPPLEIPACQTCGKTPCECVTCDTCGKVECECEVILCDKCEATQAEDGTVIHEKSCSQYKLQKGDALWIESGAFVYKDYTNANEVPHQLLFSYSVTFEQEIVAEDGTVWYEFKLDSLGDWFIWGYKYVKAENSSVEKPVECTCGTESDIHAEDCPLYVAPQCTCGADGDVHAEGCPFYVKPGIEAAVDGTTIQVMGAPEGATLSVEKISLDSYNEEVVGQIEEEAEFLFAYDITIYDADGNEWQPGDGEVTVSLSIPELEVGFYQAVKIAHMHGDELKIIDDVVVDDVNGTVTFTTDGFSDFYGYIIDFSFDGETYVIAADSAGKGSAKLSAILTAMDKNYKIADVTSVTSSNTDLVTATAKSGDWTIETKKGFNTEVTLTVKINGSTIKIRIVNPDVWFALQGAHNNWNQKETDDLMITPSGSTEAVEVTAIQSALYVDDSSYAGPDSNDIKFGKNYKVYLRPGMALAIRGGIGISNPNSTSNLSWVYNDYADGKYNFGAWSWIWDTNVNYVIANDVDGYTVTRVNIKQGSNVRTIELHIIPYNEVELLSSYLERTDNSRYSIANIPASLFDYDGRQWNTYYSQNYNTANPEETGYFAFAGSDAGVNTRKTTAGADIPAPWTGSGTATNGGGGNALMGIVENTLGNDRLPVMEVGQQVDLFGPSSNAAYGKTAYNDIEFEFIYDNVTGFYTYNSELNHAQYNSETRKIELYTQSMSPTDSNTVGLTGNDNNTKAGFYPFADINEAFISKNALGKTVDEKLAMLDNPVVSTSRLSPDLTKDFVTTATEGSTIGMHFGIYVHSDFYLPKDKKLNNKDMIYEFTGDDDLWVFIDDTLVLDIGGGHTPVSGSFNLTTGQVKVDKYSQLAAANGGGYGTQASNQTNLDIIDSFLAGLQADQMHTISIFYLERHSGESNCRMHFNLPLVPSNSVMVSKDLVNQSGEELSIIPDVDYTFELYAGVEPDKGDDVINATQYNVLANKNYTVLGPGAPSGVQQTGENGQFVLKDGQTAIFEGIERFTEVYAVEVTPDHDPFVYEGATLSVNKDTPVAYSWGSKPEVKIVQESSSISYDFTNKMKTRPLTVEKQVLGGKKALLNQDQEFEFDLVFTQDCVAQSSIATTGAVSSLTVSDKESESADVVNLGGTFKLKCDESITIPNVPVGMTFTLSEKNPDTEKNSFSAPKFEPAPSEVNSFEFGTAYSWSVVDSGTNTIVVTNTRNKLDLTITKTLTKNAPENQSFLFHVKGNDTNNASVDMDVIINFAKGENSASVTIAGIPSGSYTVTEDTDWSWRYEITSDSQVEQTKVLYENGKFEFKNERKIDQWLSGDCWCENRWNATSVTPEGTPDPKPKDPTVAS